MTPLFSDIKTLRRIIERMNEARMELKDDETVINVRITLAEYGTTRLELGDLVERMMDQTT